MKLRMKPQKFQYSCENEISRSRQKPMNKSEVMMNISAKPDYASTRVLTMESDITFNWTNIIQMTTKNKYIMYKVQD